MVHLVSGPNQVLVRCWRRPYTAMETPTFWTRMTSVIISFHYETKLSPTVAISQPKIHTNVLAAGTPIRTGPHWGSLQRPRAGFWGQGKGQGEGRGNGEGRYGKGREGKRVDPTKFSRKSTSLSPTHHTTSFSGGHQLQHVGSIDRCNQ